MPHKQKKQPVEPKIPSRGETPGKGAWLGLLFAILAMSGVIGFHLFRHRVDAPPAPINPSSIAATSSQQIIAEQSDVREDLVTLYNKGVELATKEQHEEAVEFFQRAKALAPDDVEVCIMLANSMDALKQHIEALAELRDLISRVPKIESGLLVKIHYNMGNYLWKLIRRPEAIEEYKTAISIDPKYTKAYYGLGFLLDQESRWDEAIEAYGALLAITPDDLDAKRALDGVMNRRQEASMSETTSAPAVQAGTDGPPSP